MAYHIAGIKQTSYFSCLNPSPVTIKLTCPVLIIFSCCLTVSCNKQDIDINPRLREVHYLNGQWELYLNLQYDSNGKLLSTMPNGEDALLYDGQGRLIKYFNGYMNYDFEYGPNGRIKKRIPISTIPYYHPDTIEYHYDAMERIVKCTSTFSDPYDIPQQGWVRDYLYNDKGDIIKYSGVHRYYNQTEEDILSYDNSENPLRLSNSILFFLNEHNYEALNRHNPKRKDNKVITAIYWYNFNLGKTPHIQTIMTYFSGRPVNPTTYNLLGQVKFTYD